MINRCFSGRSMVKWEGNGQGGRRGWLIGRDVGRLRTVQANL